MVKKDKIKLIARDMAITSNAERVILFGSYARGDATEHSDVDLLFIAESDLPRFKRSRALYKLLKPYPFAMDIVVYTPQEIEKGKKSKVSFVSTVLKEGETLYVRRDRDQKYLVSSHGSKMPNRKFSGICAVMQGNRPSYRGFYKSIFFSFSWSPLERCF
jgi:uncharacterized protein